VCEEQGFPTWQCPGDDAGDTPDYQLVAQLLAAARQQEQAGPAELARWEADEKNVGRKLLDRHQVPFLEQSVAIAFGGQRRSRTTGSRHRAQNRGQRAKAGRGLTKKIWKGGGAILMAWRAKALATIVDRIYLARHGRTGQEEEPHIRVVARAYDPGRGCMGPLLSKDFLLRTLTWLDTRYPDADLPYYTNQRAIEFELSKQTDNPHAAIDAALTRRPLLDEIATAPAEVRVSVALYMTPFFDFDEAMIPQQVALPPRNRTVDKARVLHALGKLRQEKRLANDAMNAELKKVEYQIEVYLWQLAKPERRLVCAKDRKSVLNQRVRWTERRLAEARKKLEIPGAQAVVRREATVVSDHDIEQHLGVTREEAEALRGVVQKWLEDQGVTIHRQKP